MAPIPLMDTSCIIFSKITPSFSKMIGTASSSSYNTKHALFGRLRNASVIHLRPALWHFPLQQQETDSTIGNFSLCFFLEVCCETFLALAVIQCMPTCSPNVSTTFHHSCTCALPIHFSKRFFRRILILSVCQISAPLLMSFFEQDSC